MKWTEQKERRKLDEKLGIHFIWPTEWSADRTARSVCIHVIKVQSRLSYDNGELLISNFSKRRVIYFISFNSNQHVTIAYDIIVSEGVGDELVILMND